jgi:hypothetical protein
MKEMLCMGENGEVEKQSKGTTRLRVGGEASLRIAAVFSQIWMQCPILSEMAIKMILGSGGRLIPITVTGNSHQNLV